MVVFLKVGEIVVVVVVGERIEEEWNNDLEVQGSRFEVHGGGREFGG